MQIPFTFLATVITGLVFGQSLPPVTPSTQRGVTTGFSGQTSCLTVSASATNALCNGDNSGSVSATAVGGTGIYQFAWQGCAGGPLYNSPAVTDLIAGCYQVTVTDGNGCSGTGTVQVFEPSAFRFTIMPDSVSCQGGSDGSAVITVKGGTPGYRYLWDNGQTTRAATGFSEGIHTVQVTDTLGCRALTVFGVLQPPGLLLDSIAFKSPSCFGKEDGAATAYAKGGTGNLTYEWSTMQMAQTATDLAAGVYTVSIRDANACTLVQVFNMPEPAPLKIVLSQISDEKCPGACNGTARVRIEGGTAPYQMAWDDIVIRAQDTTANKLCPGKYIIHALDFNSCLAIDSFDIAPGRAPVLSFDSLAPTCAGFKDGSLKINVLNGNPPYRYAWSNGGTADRVDSLDCGRYRVTITDTFDCVYVDSMSLNCPPPLDLIDISRQQPRCTGEANGAIQVQATGGTGSLRYLWSDPNAQISATASNLRAGIYTVTIQDANNCSLLVSDTLLDPSPLQVSLRATDARCFGSNDGSITALVSGGTYPYAYDWSNGDLDSIAGPLAPGLFFLAVTDALGCAAPVKSAAIGGPSEALEVVLVQTKRACEGANDGKASAMARGGNGGPYTYAWSNMDTTERVSNLPPGRYTVTVRDAKGCSDTASVGIAELASLKIKLASGRPTCFGYSDGSAAIVDFKGGTGDTALYVFNWEVAPSVNGPFLSGLKGGQTYLVTVTDNENCTVRDSIPVAEGPKVIPKISIEPVRCFGEANGSASVVSVQAAHPVASYLWSNGDTTRTITGLSPDRYGLMVVDEKGCKGVDTINITQPPLLAVQLNVVAPLRCSGDHSGIIAATVFGGTPAYRLQWSNRDTTDQIKQLGQGTYTVTVTDQNGCTNQQQINMPTPDSLDLRVAQTPPNCFDADNGRLTLSVSGGNGPYRYSIDGGPFGGSAVFFRLKAGTYFTRVLDANGCMSTVVDTLENPPPLGVSLGRDTTVEPGTLLTLRPEVSNAFGMVSYHWKLAPLDALVCADPPECTEIDVAPYRSTWYNVTVTDEKGCEGTDAIRVNVLKSREVFVPTGFSPNDDGTNDLLVVHGSSVQIKNIRSISVYDRWGELVYQEADVPLNDPNRGWDGTFRGQPCDPGVFVWTLEVEFVDGYREVLSGNITLVR